MRGICKSCRDPLDWDDAPETIPKDTRKLMKTHCWQCALELTTGKVLNQNINFFGGSPSTWDPDEAGPWQENAIRHMEGGEE